MPKLGSLRNFMRHVIFSYGNARAGSYPALTATLAGYALNTCGLFTSRRRIIKVNFKDLSVDLNAWSGEISGFWENFQDDKYAVGPADAGNYCVFDVGGNAGFFSMLQVIMHKEKLNLFTFEPDPEVFGRTRQNIERCNQDRHARVSVNNFALGSAKGSAGFVRNGSCLSHISSGRPGDSKHFDVPIDTLDNVVLANKIDRIHLMKIDVEGHEAEVLKGASRVALPITDKVVMQYHPGQYEKVCELLQSAGFSLSGRKEEKETAFFSKTASIPALDPARPTAV
jgi:FkbM family methyltransferase